MIQDIHPHLFDNAYVVDSHIQEDDYIFHFKGDAILLKVNDQSLEIPEKKDLEGCSSDGIFMFKLNNKRCFLVWDCYEPTKIAYTYHEIKFRNIIGKKELDWATGVALHLRNWYLQNKFCGKCGAPTKQKNDERAIICTSCQNTLYPIISPAIIVAVLCNDKILLARGVNFPEGFYSLVAGYVDIGESIEDAVVREVKEEVGVDIKNIRYYKSQPWPFSGSMMIGFIAEAETEQTIQADGVEVLEAAWFSRTNLPLYPPDRSIAGEIINKYINKEL